MSRVVGHQRSHLSIGEVLSLLQDEFPDVTISKIRFLESQGLLDPERTPSGYRKFYEYDIERLRWILRQQKDHYLPLKVIKDRLDRSPGHVPGADDPDDEADADDSAQAALPLGAQPERTATPQPAATPTPAPTPAPAPTPRVATDSPEQNGRGSRPTPQSTVAPRPAVPPRPQAQPARRPAAPARPRPATNNSGASALGSSLRQPSTPPATQTETNRAARPAPQVEVPRGATAFEPSADAITLDVDELAEASGLSVRDIRDLERFGLIEPRDVGDGASYDGDALVIARTAAGFLQHGIEARHMRTYKVAADREAGLFEQIVSPVLKQRNPEARTRATRTVTELIRLGEVMRGVLLRRELRDHLG